MGIAISAYGGAASTTLADGHGSVMVFINLQKGIDINAIALTLLGAIAVGLGAIFGEWPLAAAGLTLVACALLRRWA